MGPCTGEGGSGKEARSASLVLILTESDRDLISEISLNDTADECNFFSNRIELRIMRKNTTPQITKVAIMQLCVAME